MKSIASAAILVLLSLLTRSAHAGDSSGAWLLHLPGIAGECGIDHTLIDGLRKGGFDGDVELYDWVDEPGIPALGARAHNDREAQKIADMIAARSRARPGGRIVLVGHSAGTGLAVFALEKLPPEVKVDTVLLLASALSPDYDLSKALSHVRGKVYAFSSPGDAIVLGTGTTLFGTIDGRKCEAAGLRGFTCPESAADKDQYAKLVAKPYDKAWLKYDNDGDHIGVMSAPFAEAVLAPLVLDALPGGNPTTRPARGGADLRGNFKSSHTDRKPRAPAKVAPAAGS